MISIAMVVAGAAFLGLAGWGGPGTPDCTWQSDTGDEAAVRRAARRHTSRNSEVEHHHV